MTWRATADGDTISGLRTPAAMLERLERGEHLRLDDLEDGGQLMVEQAGDACIVRLEAAGAEPVRWRMTAPLGAELFADAAAANRMPPSSDWVMGDAAAPRLRRIRVSSGRAPAGGERAEGDAAPAEWTPILPAVDWIARRLEEGRSVELEIDQQLRVLAVPAEQGEARLIVSRAPGSAPADATASATARMLPHPIQVAEAANQLLLAWLSLEPRPALAAALVDADDAARAAAAERGPHGRVPA